MIRRGLAPVDGGAPRVGARVERVPFPRRYLPRRELVVEPLREPTGRGETRFTGGPAAPTRGTFGLLRGEPVPGHRDPSRAGASGPSVRARGAQGAGWATAFAPPERAMSVSKEASPAMVPPGDGRPARPLRPDGTPAPQPRAGAHPCPRSPSHDPAGGAP
jgi:hypothetical protein